METKNFLADFENLPRQIQQQVLDYLEFLISKHNRGKEKPNLSEYYKSIQTVSQWSEDDVEYLKEIEKEYNWKVEPW